MFRNSKNTARAAELRQGANNLRARANRSAQAGDPVQSERDHRTARLLDGDANRLASGQTDRENRQADARIRRFFS